MNHDKDFMQLCEQARETINEIGVDEVQARLLQPDCLFIDVREDHERQQEYIAGSIHMGKGIIERDIHTLSIDKQRDIILYCGGGYRSALAAKNLQTMGYSRVYSMVGGLRAWRLANKPIEVN